MTKRKPRVPEGLGVPEWEQLTAAKAADLLARSKNIRDLNEALAQNMARDILQGNWETNAETIKIDTDGYLVDGQHRCRAAVIAGKSITVLVVRGVASTRNVDSGMSRQAFHYMNSMGVSLAKSVQSACRMMFYYEGPGLDALGNSRVRPTRHEIMETFEQHRSIADSVKKAKMAGKMIPLGIAGFVHFVGSNEDADMADLFVDLIGTGTGLSNTDAVYWLRERAIREKAGGRGGWDTKTALALTIKSWNAHLKGRKCKQLRWNVRESMPSFVTL